MSVANLANVPETQQQLDEFSFAHAAHHRVINQRIKDVFGVILPDFIIDPMNEADLDNFAVVHQQMHDNQNEVLGIAGNNLIDIDWRDREQKTAWIWLNFQEHLQASDILRV